MVAPPDVLTAARSRGFGSSLGGLLGAIQRFKEVGATVPTTSRVRQAAELLIQADQSWPARPSLAFRRRLAEAHKIAYQFEQIARSLGVGRVKVPRDIHRDLQRAYGGELDPMIQSEGSQTARNYEFQLWVHAWLVAGEKPCRYVHPDLMTAYRFAWRGVAVKRVQSPGKMLTHVKRAATQVREHADSGFVVLGIDSYAASFRQRLAPVQHPGRLRGKLPEMEAAVAWCRRNAPWVRAVIVFIWLVRWSLKDKPMKLFHTNATLVQRIPEDAVDEEYLTSYFDEALESYRNNTLATHPPI